jgi:hypothetical protein
MTCTAGGTAEPVESAYLVSVVYAYVRTVLSTYGLRCAAKFPNRRVIAWVYILMYTVS